MFSITVPTEPLLMLVGEAALADLGEITIDLDNSSKHPSISLTANDDLSGFSLGDIPAVSSPNGCPISYKSYGYCTFPFSFEDFATLYASLRNTLEYLQEEKDRPTTTPDTLAAISRDIVRFEDLLNRCLQYMEERGLPLPC